MAWLPPRSKPPRDPHKPKRRTTTERGYGTDHEKLRTIVIAQEPVCSICKNALSEQMHHKDGNAFNRERSNVTGVCRSCHMALHKSATLPLYLEHGLNSEVQ